MESLKEQRWQRHNIYFIRASQQAASVFNEQYLISSQTSGSAVDMKNEALNQAWDEKTMNGLQSKWKGDQQG